MNTELANRSNYLVAFLAALIGLASFKDYLSQHSVTIFVHSYTWLSVSVPLLITMVLAAYIGALSHFSSNITFTRLPISRYLGSLSNVSAVVGLLYPVFIVFAMTVSYLSTWLRFGPDSIDLIYTASSSLTALISAFAVWYVSRNFNMVRDDTARLAILDSIEESLHKDIEPPKGKDKGYRFLYEYEYLHKLLVRSLQLLGYGVNNRINMVELAKILEEKGLLHKLDISVAEELNQQRNAYAHGKGAMSKSELDIALKDMANLQRRVKVAIINGIHGSHFNK